MATEHKESRTDNALKNLRSGFASNFVTLFSPFIIRTIMIHTLGVDYLGLNSLFTSILQVLNMAELGVSSAIVFSMYKPLAIGDIPTVCALLNYYRKIYSYIGCFVAVIGICLTPFLKLMIKDDIPIGINIYLLYFIYLGNTVLSYFLFAYKGSLLNATQHQSNINRINTILILLRLIYQSLALLLFRDYYLYVVGNLALTVSYNIWVNNVAKRMYPQYICSGNIDKDLINGVKS